MWFISPVCPPLVTTSEEYHRSPYGAAHVTLFLHLSQFILQLMALNRSSTSHPIIGQDRTFSRHGRLFCTCLLSTPALQLQSQHLWLWVMVALRHCHCQTERPHWVCRVSLCSPPLLIRPSQTWWQGFDSVAVVSALRRVQGGHDQWEWSDSSVLCQTPS